MSTKRRESARGKRAEDGTVLCSCGCGQVPKPPRRSWFSEACVEAWKIKNDPRHVRYLLSRRDKGICANCGMDAELEFRRYRDRYREASRLMHWFEYRESRRIACELNEAPFSDTGREILWPEAVRRGRFDRSRQGALERLEILRLAQLPDLPWNMGKSSGWDADHIHEVVRGGGQCGLENYQTLCHPCHKAKTKRLIDEMAAARRWEKVAQNSAQVLC